MLIREYHTKSTTLTISSDFNDSIAWRDSCSIIGIIQYHQWINLENMSEFLQRAHMHDLYNWLYCP